MTFVELRGGLVVPQDALALYLRLADAHPMTVADGKLTVGSGSTLTPADVAAIRQWRSHLVALATYQPDFSRPTA